MATSDTTRDSPTTDASSLRIDSTARLTSTSRAPSRRGLGTHLNPQLPAHLSRRQNLAGIQHPLGIERRFEPLHHFEIVARENQRHHVPFFNSHPVFTRNRSAHFRAFHQDFLRCFEHML